MQCSAHSKAVLDDSLITVDTTSLNCIIAPSLMYDDVVAKFARDMLMLMKDIKRNEYHTCYTINKQLSSLKVKIYFCMCYE